MSFTHRVIKNKSKVKNHVTPICATSVSAMLTLLLLAVSYCACQTQPDMRSGHCAVSAWHQPAGPKKQNVWSGFTLVSQSVSCCHAGKCILVLQNTFCNTHTPPHPNMTLVVKFLCRHMLTMWKAWTQWPSMQSIYFLFALHKSDHSFLGYSYWNKSDVKHRNTPGCQDQYTAPNIINTGGECPTPKGGEWPPPPPQMHVRAPTP